jgi:hypothetical protein
MLPFAWPHRDGLPKLPLARMISKSSFSSALLPSVLFIAVHLSDLVQVRERLVLQTIACPLIKVSWKKSENFFLCVCVCDFAFV